MSSAISFFPPPNPTKPRTPFIDQNKGLLTTSDTSQSAASSSTTSLCDINSSGEIMMDTQFLSFEQFFTQHNQRIIIRYPLNISAYIIIIALNRAILSPANKIYVAFSDKVSEINDVYPDQANKLKSFDTCASIKKTCDAILETSKLPIIFIDGVKTISSSNISELKLLCARCPHIILLPYYTNDPMRHIMQSFSNASATVYWNINIFPIIKFLSFPCPISNRQRLSYEFQCQKSKNGNIISIPNSSSSNINSITTTVNSPRFNNDVYFSYRPRVKFTHDQAIINLNNTKTQLTPKSIDYHQYTDSDEILDSLKVECDTDNVKEYICQVGNISSKLSCLLSNLILCKTQRQVVIAHDHILKVLVPILSYLHIPLLNPKDITSNPGVICSVANSNVYHHNIQHLHFWRIYPTIIDIINNHANRALNLSITLNVYNYVAIHQDGSGTTDSRLYEKYTNSMIENNYHKQQTSGYNVIVRNDKIVVYRSHKKSI